MLVLRMAGKGSVLFYGTLQWHNIRTKFYLNTSNGYRVESCGEPDGRRHNHGQLYTRSFYILRARKHNNQIA